MLSIINGLCHLLMSLIILRGIVKSRIIYLLLLELAILLRFLVILLVCWDNWISVEFHWSYLRNIDLHKTLFSLDNASIKTAIITSNNSISWSTSLVSFYFSLNYWLIIHVEVQLNWFEFS